MKFWAALLGFLIGSSAWGQSSPANDSHVLVNVHNYGAAGNYINTPGAATDDTVAFNRAIAVVNAERAKGVDAVLYIPQGRYYLNTAGTIGSPAITPFAHNIPGKVQGDGQFKSAIMLGPNFGGPVFTWDDAFQSKSYCSLGTGQNQCGIYDYTKDFEGAGATDFSIFSANPMNGNQSAGGNNYAASVIGLNFTGRFQRVYVSNVGMWDLNGSCLRVGQPSQSGNSSNLGYMGESTIKDLYCWAGGNHASFTGAISGGTTLTTSAVTRGTISIGQALTGTGLAAGSIITAGSGTSWTVFPSQSPISAEAMNGESPQIWFGANPQAGTVASNELKMYNIQSIGLFASGLVIDSNSATGNATNYTIFGFRGEFGQPVSDGFPIDLMRFGGSVNNGDMSNIHLYGVSLINIPTGDIGMHFADANTGAINNVGQVDIHGVVASYQGGAGTVFQIDGGKQIQIDGVQVGGSTGTGLTVASSTTVACCIYVTAISPQTAFSVNIDPSVIGDVFSGGSISTNGFGWDIFGNLYMNPASQSAPAWLTGGIGLQGGTAATFTDTSSTGTAVITETLYKWPCGTLASSNPITVKNIACLEIPAPTAGANVTPGTNGLLSLILDAGYLTNGPALMLGGGSFNGAPIAIGNTGNFGNTLCAGANTGLCTVGNSGNILDLEAGTLRLNGNAIASTTIPVYSAGFNTSGATVTALNTFSFSVTVGSGSATTTGKLTMPTAPNGWSCHVTDNTPASVATHSISQTANTATSVTVTDYGRTTGTAQNMVAGDVYEYTCAEN